MGFAIVPVDVSDQVCVASFSVPDQVTVPSWYVLVVEGRRLVLRALFCGFERIAIISLMPASARSYAFEFVVEYDTLRAFVEE